MDGSSHLEKSESTLKFIKTRNAVNWAMVKAVWKTEQFYHISTMTKLKI